MCIRVQHTTIDKKRFAGKSCWLLVYSKDLAYWMLDAPPVEFNMFYGVPCFKCNVFMDGTAFCHR